MRGHWKSILQSGIPNMKRSRVSFFFKVKIRVAKKIPGNAKNPKTATKPSPLTHQNAIIVRGAQEHNLQSVNLDIPKNQLVVFSGVSGSGKSSLAFDTLFAEGQRRYIESLSSYARQFLGQMPKPVVESIQGLAPTISIQQKSASKNPRSTVGTITEIHDFLRVLYARIGVGHCPTCKRPIEAQTREQIVERLKAWGQSDRLLILAPLAKAQKGEFKDLFLDLLKKGFLRARVDGKIVKLDEELGLDKRIRHNIELVLDRIQATGDRSRLAESVENALLQGNGELIAVREGKDDKESSSQSELTLSSKYACIKCQISFAEPTPQMFSFNSPKGMCPSCEGMGQTFTISPELLIPDQSFSFFKGAVVLAGSMAGMGKWRRHIFEGIAEAIGIDLKAPWQSLPDTHKNALLYGTGDTHITYTWKRRGGTVWKHGGVWEGIIPQLMSNFKKVAAGPRKMQLQKYMSVLPCSACAGQRLNPQARAVKVGGQTICELESLPIALVNGWIQPGNGSLETLLGPVERLIAAELFKEIRTRVGFLMDVGLHYLSLNRSAPTLSGGETQRIRLASQIGCGLVGVLYILDEPSIGLHPRDNERLLGSLRKLRDQGNSVIVVEHDEDTMLAADQIVDFGPGPGLRGGHVVAQGPLATILQSQESITGQFLSGVRSVPIPKTRRKGNGKALVIVGARQNNLKNLTIQFPLGMFLCVTGASGSGKSSLVNEILLEGLKRLHQSIPEEEEDEAVLSGVGIHDRLDGADHIDKVIAIDQSPIGRTPRSNPGTYIKVFDEIRKLFAVAPEAKIRGWKPGRFSFNRPGGRCETCEGNGSNRLEMDFLADVWVTCPVCEGKRFNHETLLVRWRGKNIHEVLDFNIEEALVHFANIPKIRDMLTTMVSVGMDYVKIGQPAPTLSGGEAQRIKLAKELCKKSTGKTLYILDEPTTGLHFEDVRKLLEVLHALVDLGNTVLVIEHNMDVIKTADWVIDMGPDGGSGGGELVVEGTPETVAKNKKSYTGIALKAFFDPDRIKKTLPLQKKKGQFDPPTDPGFLRVEGASQHNLREVNLEIPRGAMTVFCGPSGSGKSSMAFDTIYAEGQRRYIESLSSYARQFLGQMEKPRLTKVSGLSPAICIEQKSAPRSPRSTVGTVTEIHDYLRVLYTRMGTPHCPDCSIPVGTQSREEIVRRLGSLTEGTKLYLLAPLQRKGQEKYSHLVEEVRRLGYSRMRIDGTTHEIETLPEIDPKRRHKIEAVVDRVMVRQTQLSRLAESVEAALQLGQGTMMVAWVDSEKAEKDWRVERFSQLLSCHQCGKGFEALNSHHFSFNSPLGWCQTCEGLGFRDGIDLSFAVRNPVLTLRQGVLSFWPTLHPQNQEIPPPFNSWATAIAQFLGISLDTPYGQLSEKAKQLLLHGFGEKEIPLEPNSQTHFQYRGFVGALAEQLRHDPNRKEELASLIGHVPCPKCHGARLRPEPASVRLDLGHNRFPTLHELCSQRIAVIHDWFTAFEPVGEWKKVTNDLLNEVRGRLGFLVQVGLDYVSLARSAPTLSGGESQRIRLASQIGSGLTGVLYVLDEPTIGLHPRDNHRLLDALVKLRNLGNTLVIVEHDRDVIAAADRVVDFGPGAGDFGGQIVGQGTLAELCEIKESLTGQYMSGNRVISIPKQRRFPIKKGRIYPPAFIEVRGARQNNLKNITIRFPLGGVIAVTGVSGSGKSSLVEDVLRGALLRQLNRIKVAPAMVDEIRGLAALDKLIHIDQNPIGNTPQSNPATFTGLFDHIRDFFARLPESKIRGWLPKRFSFNKPGGRCEACEGNGQRKIEMHFLADIWVTCAECAGKRYAPETLLITYKNKNISDVLHLRVSEALALFASFPRMRRILQTLEEVGLGYITLGQSSPTLSGGEAQRVKLTAELAKPSTGRTLYLLDEPTTGLHFEDVARLVEVIHRLCDGGNTVVLVEHNLDVIKNADWVIDLGPDAGPSGGEVVIQGPPEAIVDGEWIGVEDEIIPTSAKGQKSHTAKSLAPLLALATKIDRQSKPSLWQKPIQEEEEPPIEEVQTPWEANGRQWHLVNRIDHDGKPCRWEGEALAWIEQQFQSSKEFDPSQLFAPWDWNQRHVVEVRASEKPTWFLHAMTCQGWLMRLVFRVPTKTFDQDTLDAQLEIPSLNDTEGVPKYSSESRVKCGKISVQGKAMQVVTIQVFRKAEIATPAFRIFLMEASLAYLGSAKPKGSKKS